MHWLLKKPGVGQRQALLQDLQHLPLSYEEKGGTDGDLPSGYQHDRYRIQVGEGRPDFVRAKKAIFQLAMFPSGWIVVDSLERVQPGTVVLVVAKVLVGWIVNGCRVIYLTDESDRAGFAYGTLTQHVEQGEEYFGVELDSEGRVWYEVKVFSRPRYWLARLGYPVTRWFQRRFVRHSQRAVRAFLNSR
jgi:uncharacterized protein (UPF0548 family)